jgi:hypothetical protein
MSGPTLPCVVMLERNDTDQTDPWTISYDERSEPDQAGVIGQVRVQKAALPSRAPYLLRLTLQVCD